MRDTGPRIFSVEEANAALPTVKELLARLRSVTLAGTQKQDEADLMELEFLQPDGQVSTMGQGRIQGVLGTLKQLEQEFVGVVDQFEDLGCELKDLEQGLVDFYTYRHGELAYLCWKEGEGAITHWHPLEGGYAARQPL